jgi:hypothetical protein
LSFGHYIINVKPHMELNSGTYYYLDGNDSTCFFGMLLEDDDVSMASYDSINTLHDIVIPHIIAYTTYIYAPMVDYTIPFWFTR